MPQAGRPPRRAATVRVLSELTIANGASPMSLELSGGRMGLSVARQLMGTGETVDVHTPNSVASMRGSVAIVDVRPAEPGAGGAIGPIEDLTDEEVGRLAAALTSSERQHADAASAFKEELTVRQQSRALTSTLRALEDLIKFTLEPSRSDDLPRAPTATVPAAEAVAVPTDGAPLGAVKGGPTGSPSRVGR